MLKISWFPSFSLERIQSTQVGSQLLSVSPFLISITNRLQHSVKLGLLTCLLPTQAGSLACAVVALAIMISMELAAAVIIDVGFMLFVVCGYVDVGVEGGVPAEW